jgi:hypothetical protein
LEVRGGPGRDRLHRGTGARAAVRRRSGPGIGAHVPRRRLPLRLRLTGNRRTIAGPRVIENDHKWDGSGSEPLLFGRNFGIGTDVQTGPNGNLYVVSLTNGAVYEIHRTRPGR